MPSKVDIPSRSNLLIPLTRQKLAAKNQQLTPLIFAIFECSRRNIKPIWLPVPSGRDPSYFSIAISKYISSVPLASLTPVT
jgi:hypothetical protein